MQTNTKPKCPQCNKEIANPVSDTIIQRAYDPNRRRKFIERAVMEFCSQTCASHYQMSREG